MPPGPFRRSACIHRRAWQVCAHFTGLGLWSEQRGWRGYASWREYVGQEGGVRPHLHVCAVPEVLCKKRLQSLTRHAPSGISPIHKPDKMAALPSKVLQGNFHWTNKRSHYPPAPEMSKLPRLLPSPRSFTLPSIPLFRRPSPGLGFIRAHLFHWLRLPCCQGQVKGTQPRLESFVTWCSSRADISTAAEACCTHSCLHLWH